VATITFDDVGKIYPGGTRAIEGVNMEIEDGEFVVLVGPSGCGKSTLLRMIAGLEEISEGTISIGDRVVNDVAPKDRDIAMVFQNYALYPHMTVYDNMAFGLKLRKFSKDDIERRVQEAARILEITEYLDRKPKALSGGQRQRVAMGRAIVREPSAFLMDEPLSNLDAKLRVQMRSELGGHHHGLRDPRPGGGHDDGGSGRRHAQGRPPAGGFTDDALHQPHEPVRRRVHRQSLDELHRRQVDPHRGFDAGADIRQRDAGVAAGPRALQRRRDRGGHPPRGIRGRR
jgi:ABC-type nitrate/sulfonate/bicarbonate transport system ATPase subunit